MPVQGREVVSNYFVLILLDHILYGWTNGPVNLDSVMNALFLARERNALVIILDADRVECCEVG